MKDRPSSTGKLGLQDEHHTTRRKLKLSIKISVNSLWSYCWDSASRTVSADPVASVGLGVVREGERFGGLRLQPGMKKATAKSSGAYLRRPSWFWVSGVVPSLEPAVQDAITPAIKESVIGLSCKLSPHRSLFARRLSGRFDRHSGMFFVIRDSALV